jgi:hypothetical protein
MAVTICKHIGTFPSQWQPARQLAAAGYKGQLSTFCSGHMHPTSHHFPDEFRGVKAVSADQEYTVVTPNTVENETATVEQDKNNGLYRFLLFDITFIYLGLCYFLASRVSFYVLCLYAKYRLYE